MGVLTDSKKASRHDLNTFRMRVLLVHTKGAVTDVMPLVHPNIYNNGASHIYESDISWCKDIRQGKRES